MAFEYVLLLNIKTMIPNYRNFFSPLSHERDLSDCRAAGSQAFTTQTHSRHVARTPNLHQHFVASSQFHGVSGFDGRRTRASAQTGPLRERRICIAPLTLITNPPVILNLI